MLEDPGEGWLVMALAAGGAALAATNHFLSGLAHLFGFTRETEEKRRTEYDERALAIMRGELTTFRREVSQQVEQSVSEVRQHVSAVQLGVDGKQRVLEDRISQFYKEMRDRDEQLADRLYARISTDIKSAEERLARQIEQIGKSFADMIAAAIAKTRR